MKVKRMKLATIIGPFGTAELVKCEVSVDPRCPGLAVCRYPDTLWSVVHIASGEILATLPTRKAAAAILQKLVTLSVWSQPLNAYIHLDARGRNRLQDLIENMCRRVKL